MKRRLFFILLAALSVVTVMAQGRKELRFNEIMVANDSSYMDQYGRHVPWVEVFNRSYGTVGMEQMFISNQPIDIPTSGIKPKDVPLPEKAGGMELAQLAAQYSDGVIFGSAGVDPALRDFVGTLGKPVLPFDANALADGSYMDQYNAFYDQLL